METKRTEQQNRAIHLLFRHMAEELNDAGLDMRKTLKPTVSIPWNEKTVKEFLWRPVMKAQLGKESTTELSSKEIDEVYGTLNRHLADRFGLHTPFPSIESIINQQMMSEASRSYKPRSGFGLAKS